MEIRKRLKPDPYVDLNIWGGGVELAISENVAWKRHLICSKDGLEGAELRFQLHSFFS